MNLEHRLIFAGLSKLAAPQKEQKEEKKKEEKQPSSPAKRKQVYRPSKAHNSVLGDMARDALATSAVAVPAITGFGAGRRMIRNYAKNRPLDTGVAGTAKGHLIAAAMGAPIVGAGHGLIRHLIGG